MATIAILHHPEAFRAAEDCRTHFAGLRIAEGHTVALCATDHASAALAADVTVVLMTPGLVAWWLDASVAEVLGAKTVVPVPVRSCDVPSGLRRLQALPRDGSAIEGRRDEDGAWVEVVRGVRQVLAKLGGGR